ncbi:MAG: energy-coupling factor ABC transporter ATP-binding protein [Chloroflexi bacterium]|nr:energy-coupling factor ABC transporter ATP-binding protein [Chloroflexota bacterium]
MHTPLIRLQNVTFHYPHSDRPALNQVNVAIQEGDFVLVIGPSGAGKSTLLRTLNGLVPHFSGGRIAGKITVAGHDPIAEGPHRMSPIVGLVQQDPEAQFVVDTVEDELAFGMENQGLPQTVMRKRVEEVLDQLGIAHLRQRRISSLSAGEKQRVAIGSVLTLQPKVLVLDEPTSQLDPQAAEEVLTTLRHLNQDLGLTVVLSEHRLERVVQYADQIIYLPALGSQPMLGKAEEVLPQVPFAPPLVQLAKAFHWQPLPLTIKEARPFISQMDMQRALPRETHQPGLRREYNPVHVEAHEVWFNYNGVEALRRVSLRAGEGELIALMGRNGSGKTTLLKHLVGLLQPKRGYVVVHGQDTRRTSLETLIRYVGYVPQDPSTLLFADTVRQELEFTRRAHALSLAGVQSWLEKLGLTQLAELYPRELSVGQRQRVAIAAILVAEPPTLLLDEPTRGLDPVEKQALADFLRAQTEQGRTVILATHDVELAAACAHRVVILSEGQVAVDGPTREVMSQSLVFASQVNKLFRDPRLLTVKDVLEALGR